MAMTTTSKISWVLGSMVSVLTVFVLASDIKNPLTPYIIEIGEDHFASIQVEEDIDDLEEDVDQALENQRLILRKFERLEQDDLKEEIYEARKSQCAAETQFQKDFYHDKMLELRQEYIDLFGTEYDAPDCREI